MDDLHVNGKLTATVVKDEDANGATARLESAVEARVKVGLVNDRETLLDIASLSHGNDLTLLHVEDTVLLEDRAEHGLNDNTGGRVGDERGLLVKLLGEEVDTKVAVLTGSRGGRDADDLAGAALEHQEITQTDVVAWDADGVGNAVSGRARTLVNVDLDRAAALVTELVHAAGAHGVEVTVVVVVTHLGLVVWLGSLDGFFGKSHVLLVRWTRNGIVNGEVVDLGCLGVSVLRLGRAGVNSEVVDLSLLRGVVLRSRRSSVNGEVVELGLLGVLVLRARGTFVNSEVVELGLLR